MLLYGAEVLGARKYECIERAHYYLCKRFMNTSLNASNYAVIGECGRYPLYIEPPPPKKKESLNIDLKVSICLIINM